MTLLERISAPEEHATVERRLVGALRELPGAVGLAIAHFPSGTRAIFVVNEAAADFYAVEESAMERLVEVRRSFPDAAINVLCLSRGDAASMNVSDQANVYSFV
jgi:hypothetical protein